MDLIKDLSLIIPLSALGAGVVMLGYFTAIVVDLAALIGG